MTAKISGLHIRYDVPTKCTLVASILSKQYQTSDELVAYIKEQAAILNVNHITVRTWIGMYGHCYQLGMQLPKGVMSHSFETINNKTDLNNTFRELAQIRASIDSLKLKREKPNNPKYARPKKKQTSTQILSRLFEELNKCKTKNQLRYIIFKKDIIWLNYLWGSHF